LPAGLVLGRLGTAFAAYLQLESYISLEKNSSTTMKRTFCG